jgi:hypothetical protein
MSQHFVQISVGDYLGCEQFMAANPSIFQENPNQLLQEAVRLAKEGKSAQARACVQQTLLLNICSKMMNKEFRNFFAQMKANDKETLQDFQRDFDRIINTVLAPAPTAGSTNPPSEQPTKPIQVQKPLLIDNNDQRRPTVGSSYSKNVATRHNKIDEEMSAPLAPLAIGDCHGQEGNNSTKLGVFGPPVPRNRGSMEGMLTISSEPSTTTGTRGIADPDVQRELLDPRYQKRPDPGKFFVKGRAFALRWRQSAEESLPQPDLSDVEHSTTGKYGEAIFSRIRRMVVVRERFGCCICVPITTYKCQGVLKSDLAASERHAHAIIYSSSTQPEYKAQEKERMVKKPIAVDMANPIKSSTP